MRARWRSVSGGVVQLMSMLLRRRRWRRKRPDRRRRGFEQYSGPRRSASIVPPSDSDAIIASEWNLWFRANAICGRTDASTGRPASAPSRAGRTWPRPTGYNDREAARMARLGFLDARVVVCGPRRDRIKRRWRRGMQPRAYRLAKTRRCRRWRFHATCCNDDSDEYKYISLAVLGTDTGSLLVEKLRVAKTNIFWPTVLCKVAPLSQHVVCRLSSVTFCIVACMTGRPQMFAPTRGVSGMADSMEPCTMLRGRPLLPWQRPLA